MPNIEGALSLAGTACYAWRDPSARESTSVFSLQHRPSVAPRSPCFLPLSRSRGRLWGDATPAREARGRMGRGQVHELSLVCLSSRLAARKVTHNLITQRRPSGFVPDSDWLIPALSFTATRTSTIVLARCAVVHRFCQLASRNFRGFGSRTSPARTRLPCPQAVADDASRVEDMARLCSRLSTTTAGACITRPTTRVTAAVALSGPARANRGAAQDRGNGNVLNFPLPFERCRIYSSGFSLSLSLRFRACGLPIIPNAHL